MTKLLLNSLAQCRQIASLDDAANRHPYRLSSLDERTGAQSDKTLVAIVGFVSHHTGRQGSHKVDVPGQQSK